MTEPLYALHHVNAKLGVQLRWPKDRYPAGPKEEVEAMARRIASRTTQDDWITQALPDVGQGTGVTAAVDYLPSEEDVDPDSLAEGKGLQDVEGRDERDDNAGDRAGLHTSSLADTDTKFAALRDHQSDSLTVLYAGRKVAHWEGAALQAAIDNGTLDPRRMEASAIEVCKIASPMGKPEPDPAADLVDVTSKVHHYLDQAALTAEHHFTMDPEQAEPLDEPEWLTEIVPAQVHQALIELGKDSPFLQHPGILVRMSNELRGNPSAYTALACVNLNTQPGEIQSYSLGEKEITLFSDPLWAKVEAETGGISPEQRQEAINSYRGMLRFSPTPGSDYALLNLAGKRWVRYITPAGADALLTQFAPEGQP